MKQKGIIVLAWFLSSVAGWAQSYTLKGTVTDEQTKEALIGVNILIVGGNQGTVSDIDGNFSLSVPSSGTVRLKFKYIGYKDIEVALKGEKTLDIEMQTNSTEIEEIVVIGYGKQKKESVIGSISTMSGRELTSMPVSNITQSLAGKVAGVQIVQPSGEVGNDEATIYVRGIATFNNATPIYIVDGVERSSIAQIDPNEIQSFNVLKDASATAVYGIRGANGVIIITTKRGSTGAPSVSFSAQLAVTQPTRIPQPLDAYKTTALKNLHLANGGNADKYSALELLQYRTHASPYAYPDVDWVGEVMKDHSTMQQYNVNVSGGTELVKYFVSGGFLTQNGFYKHDDKTRFSRYNFRSNIDFDVSKDFSVSFNLGARIENRTYPGVAWYGSWPVYRAAFALGGYKYPVYNPDGSYGSDGDNNYNNIVGRLENSGIYKNTRSVLEMSLNGRYKLDKILHGLAARAQIALDNTGENAALWNETYATYGYNLTKNGYQRYGENSPLTFDWENGAFDRKLYLEAGLEYAQSFGIHSVTGLLLANRDDRVINTFISYAAQGLLGRATYDFDKRYFAEVNIGYNGSENFPKNSRYGIFPAFALGWMISNEKFITQTRLFNIISMLKLRGSIGWVGNDKLGGDIVSDAYQSKRFIYLQTYDNVEGVPVGIGDTKLQGIRQGAIANTNVSWEVARKSNIGIESEFWKGLLGATVEYFYEYRDRILVDNIDKITPSFSGAEFKPANMGIVTNRGFDVEFSHRRQLRSDLSYFVKGNFSFAQNKVIRRSDPEGMLPYQCEAGYPIGVQSMYQVIGIFQDYDDIANSPSQLGLPGNTEVLPGDLKYLDFNGDGMITIADAFRQGYGTVPEIQYGLSVGANYKGFDFNVLFQGSGRSQFEKNWEIMYHFSNNDNVFEKHWYYWTPELSGNEQYIRLYGSKYYNNEPGGAESGSTYKMGSGNYLRLKTAELGYTLPPHITKKVLMSSVRVYMSGVNLFLWAKEPYLDPDNRDNRGGVMPQTRAFNLGVNINF